MNMPDKLADAFADTIVHQATIQVGYTSHFLVNFVLSGFGHIGKFYINHRECPGWYLHRDGIVRHTVQHNSEWSGYYDSLADCQLAIHKYRELQSN